MLTLTRIPLLADGGGGDGARSTADGDGAGLHHLADAVGLQILQQGRDLRRGTRRLDRERLRGDVDGLGAEQLHDLQHLAADRGIGPHLHQEHLALHRLGRLQLHDLEDVNELVELLRDLLEGEVLDGDDDRHAGDVGVLGGPDGQRLDVEAAPREQARHAGEHTGLVLDEHRQRVALHHGWASSMTASISAGPAASSSLSNSGRMLRAAMIWSLPVPAATIGHTCASAPTTKSITTGRSLIAMASWMTRSTSSRDSARRPTQPMASASSLKSGMRCLCVPRSVLE